MLFFELTKKVFSIFCLLKMVTKRIQFIKTSFFSQNCKIEKSRGKHVKLEAILEKSELFSYLWHLTGHFSELYINWDIFNTVLTRNTGWSNLEIATYRRQLFLNIIIIRSLLFRQTFVWISEIGSLLILTAC